jgi:hypothetical protein
MSISGKMELSNRILSSLTIHNVITMSSEVLISSRTPHTNHQEEEAKRKDHLQISYPK